MATSIRKGQMRMELCVSNSLFGFSSSCLLPFAAGRCVFKEGEEDEDGDQSPSAAAAAATQVCDNDQQQQSELNLLHV